MIKGALIELVQESLPQLDKTGKYDDRVVESYISLAVNSVFGQIFRKDAGNYDLYAKEYVGTILQDASTEQYYSEYPAPIVQTVDPFKGVRSINTLKGRGLEFAPARSSDMALFEGITAFNVSNVIPFIPQRDRVLYIGEPIDEDYQTIESVRMMLVVPFTEYDMDEFFHIPEGADLNIVDTVRQLMGQIPPRDLLNDGKERQWKE